MKTKKNKYSFTDLLLNNVIKRDTVVRLDNTFLDFVIMHLLPHLIGITSDDDMFSLGNKVYRELTGLINEWEIPEFNNFESRLSISEEEEYHKDVIHGLITATLEFAYNLYELQKNSLKSDKSEHKKERPKRSLLIIRYEFQYIIWLAI